MVWTKNLRQLQTMTSLLLSFATELGSVTAGIVAASAILWFTHYKLQVHGWMEGLTAFTIFYFTSIPITGYLPVTSNFYNVGVVFCLAPAIFHIASYFNVVDQMNV